MKGSYDPTTDTVTIVLPYNDASALREVAFKGLKADPESTDAQISSVVALQLQVIDATVQKRSLVNA